MIKNELLRLSHSVGNDLSLVQGGGGNTSVKVNSTIMYIKASGTTLAAMTSDSGYAVINRIGDFITTEHSERPSMEFPMHWLLPRCVIHTHSIYANIYNCMVDGKQWLMEKFVDFQPLYVPYTTPGIALASRIEELLKDIKLPLVIFLENHGLITCHDNVEETIHLTYLVHNKIKHLLSEQIPNFQPFQLNAMALPPQQFFFPDAAVLKRPDIWAANNYIEQTIRVLKKTPKALTVDEVTKLCTMESEQYRIKLNC